MTELTTFPAPFATSALRDPQTFHRRLAHWNHRRLDAGLPNEDWRADLREEIERLYQGSHNAGRPMVLSGGLDWKPMSLTPADMDFVEQRNVAAREIALAFGVPPMLLGIPGDNTYANFQEANRVFWRQTILPLASRY